MPWFTCETCNDSIKKPKLNNHFSMCSGYYFSCVDCLQTFDRKTVQSHTTCLTEHEKYALSATKPGGFAAAGVPANPQGGAANKAADNEPTGLEFLTNRPPWKCNLCNVPCTSRETLMSHASGTKHKRKVRAATGQTSNPNSVAGDNSALAGVQTAKQETAEAAAQPNGSTPEAAGKEAAPANTDKASKMDKKKKTVKGEDAETDDVEDGTQRKKKKQKNSDELAGPTAEVQKSENDEKAAEGEVVKQNGAAVEAAAGGKKQKKDKKKKGTADEQDQLAADPKTVAAEELDVGKKKSEKKNKKKKESAGEQEEAAAAEAVVKATEVGKLNGKKEKKRKEKEAAVEEHAAGQNGVADIAAAADKKKEKKQKKKIADVPKEGPVMNGSEAAEGLTNGVKSPGTEDKKDKGKNKKKKEKGVEEAKTDPSLKVVKKKMKKAAR